MLRSLVLGVANRPFARRLATGGLGRRVALRFVAGEELDQAMEVADTLHQDGFAVSLDSLGENVTDEATARAATDVYVQACERFAAAGTASNVSAKLTQLGLDLDPKLAYANADRIVSAAAAANVTVTLDMEDHRYTDRTIDACLRLHGAHPGRTGVAIQSYLRRTEADLERLLEAGVPVRLCKGAYKEPRAIAYRRRKAIDAAYARGAVRLIEAGVFPMIATHDDRLIDHVIDAADKANRAKDTFEFQMLYGVRRELQRSLIDRGYTLRVYVPFGSQWYPYLMRRIAERPANVRFFVESLLRG